MNQIFRDILLGLCVGLIFSIVFGLLIGIVCGLISGTLIGVSDYILGRIFRDKKVELIINNMKGGKE